MDVQACETDEAHDSRRDSENVQIQQSLGVLSGGDILNIDEGQFVLVVGSTLAFSRAFRLSCSGDVS